MKVARPASDVKRKVTGNWKLDVVIDQTGAVRDVRIAERPKMEPEWPEFEAQVLSTVKGARIGPATVDGQTTAHYLADRLATAEVAVTMLARGVPVGGELDWLDDGTIAQAEQHLQPFLPVRADDVDTFVGVDVEQRELGFRRRGPHRPRLRERSVRAL